MIDVIFQVGLSNAALSLVLAVIAAVVGLRTRNSHLTHLLWLLLFIKLMTPPMMSVHWSLFTAACTAVVALSGMHSPAISVVPQAALFSVAEPWLVSLWVTGAIFYLVWSLFTSNAIPSLADAMLETGSTRPGGASVLQSRKVKSLRNRAPNG